MAEAEDVITDAARHATVFVQTLWRRHRQRTAAPALALADVAARLALLGSAAFGREFVLRPAQPPAPRTWLDKLLRRNEAPPAAQALPATDGISIWLPRGYPELADDGAALARYRLQMLRLAMRAVRGGPARHPHGESAAVQACFHILDARAADDELARLLPGMLPALRSLREEALAARPTLGTLADAPRLLETLVRAVLAEAPGICFATLPAGVDAVLAQAREWVAAQAPGLRHMRGGLLTRDAWLGDYPPAREEDGAVRPPLADGDTENGAPRSGRLARRPDVRPAAAGVDDTAGPGPQMVQTAQPHEQAEDPFGMERPVDRDVDTAADDFADALSELPAARLVAAPGRPREVLVSDDPPERHARQAPAPPAAGDGAVFTYPEWDWRAQAYRHPGATVTVQTAAAGPQATVDAMLARHALALPAVRRHFELLRASRTRLRRQLDGDDIDLQGWIDNQAVLRGGGAPEQRLYETTRRGRRDLAVTLLVDISGSTDGWVSGHCRVIDVEREALLMVCVALDGLGEPFSVLGFSGEGPGGVVVRAVKRFGEEYDGGVALRIAGMEPERFTRAGAAMRHAAADLMVQRAGHRLLILLSDGKPNDTDEYDGRYGVEDLRQAVAEARLQGISPFCLTIEQQVAAYLPAVFGAEAYALIQRAELLPAILLGWLRRLVAA